MNPLLGFVALLLGGALLRMLLAPKRATLGSNAARGSLLAELLAPAIERRLGGYRQRIDDADDTRPAELATPRTALVVGGGIAGMTAATTLAERGFRVTLRDKNPYLGGKIGAWTERGSQGQSLEVEHGFHAFFRHYYNLDAVLERVGVRRTFAPIDDYLIVTHAKERLSFDDRVRTPILNLLDLRAKGLYRLRDILFSRAREEMGVFLEYDPDKTFAAYDGVNFDAFADRAELPAKLRVVFNTFARAFFSEGDRLSLAELVKSFHFYYLSNDAGLLFDFPVEHYEAAVLGPWRRRMASLGVTIELGRGVGAIEPRASGGGYDVDGEAYDALVLASDAQGARRIVGASPALAAAHPELASSLASVRSSQRYAVWRLWLDRRVRDDVPVFVNTERFTLLDSVSMYHRITPSARAWAEQQGGSVLELHSYAVPDRLADELQVKEALRAELDTFFPELAGARIVEEAFQLKDDFTAFHRGLHARRPTTETEAPGLVLAGDWVKLPCPAMLMEAAATSGLLAANVLLAREGLASEPVYTVPRRGLMPHRDRALPGPTPGSLEREPTLG
ncbi:MAG: FAD-dependent oxidoreductase [Deltaproteobacteria bacterium]|nr:FAD-dependent oxidoreductase [Deltaproteobacteria bacterium]